MDIETLSEQACYGGRQGFYMHESKTTGTPMRFAVYIPPQAANGPVPAVFYLAGLTCTEETATIKAGAQAHAARLGLALIMPDTSPRGAGISGEDDGWDFGTGAGFYVDATTEPWRNHYRMYSYVTSELYDLVMDRFELRSEATGVFGHSMGGHGALTIALKCPQQFRSVSAFAPICAPTQCPWGEKAFSGYLGDNIETWKAHDASELVAAKPLETEILIDQGLDDQFLEEQLHPHLFEQACATAGQSVNLRRQKGYDHSYYFIQTFMGDHLEHHYKILSTL
jgi:S-formylglutathione hydrolase